MQFVFGRISFTTKNSFCSIMLCQRREKCLAENWYVPFLHFNKIPANGVNQVLNRHYHHLLKILIKIIPAMIYDVTQLENQVRANITVRTV